MAESSKGAEKSGTLVNRASCYHLLFLGGGRTGVRAKHGGREERERISTQTDKEGKGKESTGSEDFPVGSCKKGARAARKRVGARSRAKKPLLGEKERQA